MSRRIDPFLRYVLAVDKECWNTLGCTVHDLAPTGQNDAARWGHDPEVWILNLRLMGYSPKRAAHFIIAGATPKHQPEAAPWTGTEGQDRKTYSDTQDRENYGSAP